MGAVLLPVAGGSDRHDPAVLNISRSRLGRLVSIRDNDLAAELLGVNLFRKLRAFFMPPSGRWPGR
jgi:hypothetical protein